jgi:hypothetical protein
MMKSKKGNTLIFLEPGFSGNIGMPVSLMELHRIYRELSRPSRMNPTYGKCLGLRGLLPWT